MSVKVVHKMLMKLTPDDAVVTQPSKRITLDGILRL